MKTRVLATGVTEALGNEPDLRVSLEPGPVVWNGQSPACPKLRLEIDLALKTVFETPPTVAA